MDLVDPGRVGRSGEGRLRVSDMRREESRRRPAGGPVLDLVASKVSTSLDAARDR